MIADAGSADASAVADAGAPLDAGGSADSGEVPGPTFEADIAPIFQFQCQGCHFVTDLPPRIFLSDEAETTYQRLVSMPAEDGPLNYIEPGDPERSYLFLKIENRHRAAGGMGNHMPPPAARRRVPAADVELIRAWIAGGAPL